jgi:hypothetical protein
MAKYDPEEEKRMAEAIVFYRKTPGAIKHQVAKQFRVPLRKWKARLEGRPAQNTKGGHNKLLTDDQELALRQFIDFLIYLGHKADQRAIRAAANKLLDYTGSTHPATRLWASRWFKRNKDWFKTLRAKTLAQERKAAHRKEDLEEHFKEFYSALEKWGITFADVYNMDETGFRIGVLRGRIVITHLNTKTVYLADPDNRESLTTIETVCANGSAIPPFLILKGEVLQEEHFENELEDEAVLSTSPSGYTNEQLSMKFIKHFHNQTYKKTKGRWRMLIFDGHGSHTSKEFLYYCWAHKIVPFQLPPHSTHLLQPLDIGLFQPLKHWHQVSIAEKIQYGDITYTKVDFLKAYQSIRDKTFRLRNILSAFKKAGLLGPKTTHFAFEKLVHFQESKGMISSRNFV